MIIDDLSSLVASSQGKVCFGNEGEGKTAQVLCGKRQIPGRRRQGGRRLFKEVLQETSNLQRGLQGNLQEGDQENLQELNRIEETRLRSFDSKNVRFLCTKSSTSNQEGLYVLGRVDDGLIVSEQLDEE